MSLIFLGFVAADVLPFAAGKAAQSVIKVGGKVASKATDLLSKSNSTGYIYTQTVLNNIEDITNTGERARPFMNSKFVIDEIIAARGAIPDETISGAFRYDVSGTFNGSKGTWELVIHPGEKKVFHFNFVTK